MPPPASIPQEQGRGCQLSEALLFLFVFSRGGRASGLKAAFQLQKGSLYPPILLLETPSLVFALKGAEGDQTCEGPHCRGSRAQAWPLPALAQDALCDRGTLCPFWGREPKAHPSSPPSVSPAAEWCLLGSVTWGCLGLSLCLSPAAAFPSPQHHPAEPRDAGEQEFRVQGLIARGGSVSSPREQATGREEVTSSCPRGGSGWILEKTQWCFTVEKLLSTCRPG